MQKDVLWKLQRRLLGVQRMLRNVQRRMRGELRGRLLYNVLRVLGRLRRNMQ